MPPNLALRVHAKITEMIMQRQLAGGDVIVEGRLTRDLGVSRTPLREALVRLEGEGLLVKEANRSFRVRKVDAAEYFQSMKVRELLEPEAVVLAIGKVSAEQLAQARRLIGELLAEPERPHVEHFRIDDHLHTMFAQASGNAVLAHTIDALRISCRLFKIDWLRDRTPPTCREHLDIIDAFEKSDAKLARQMMTQHIRQLSRDVMENMVGA